MAKHEQKGCLDMYRWLVLASLLALPTTAVAAERAVGHWVYDTAAPKYVYAATVNDSGHVFGQYCDLKGMCHWMLVLDMPCRDGAKYAAIAKSNARVTPLEVTCTGRLGSALYRFVFNDFDKVAALVSKAPNSSEVGFAIALNDGEFRAVRFSLLGAAPAIASMTSEGSERLKRTPSAKRQPL